ncbi:MAG: hypothetical protein C0483_23960 [Pirellula sp.]|nr:hypothetical protein [Pirellula sp.]
MSFLAPWFIVAGMAAISLPVLFHFFRRTPRGRMPFSTLMFLTPSPPRLTSRSKLENWPLLLLRAAILLLLAITFGRPLWRQLLELQNDAPTATRTVLLVDTSASMRRGDLWSQAMSAAAKAVSAAGPHDELSIMAFDAEVRKPLTLEAWRQAPPDERNALAQAALGSLSAGWSATQMDQALIAAAEELEAADVGGTGMEESPNKRPAGGAVRKQIVLVTDLQTGARSADLQRFEWPKSIDVKIVSVATPTANAGLHGLQTTADAASPEAAAERLRVLVSNAGDSRREQFELAWQPLAAETTSKQATADKATSPTTTYIPPGQTRVIRAPALPAGGALKLLLKGDDEPFDNCLFIMPPVKEHVRVLHLSDDPADDPQTLRYFLERAFDDASGVRAVKVETIAPHAATTRAPTPADLEDVALVVIAVERTLPDNWNAALTSWVDQGGAALCVLPNASATAWRALLPVDLQGPEHIKLSESDRAREYALLGDIDFRHPLFAPLADPRFSDFTKIRVWRHRRALLDDAAAKQFRVPARFDNGGSDAAGDPAVLELARGAGRVVLFTFGWQPRESQLGVSSKFIPIVTMLVELGRRIAPPPANYDAGEIVDLAQLDAGAAKKAAATKGWTIKTPDGKETPVAADSPKFTLAAGPGIYEVRSPVGLHRIAVNVAADESRTAPLGVEALEALGVRLAKDVPEATPELVAERRTLQVQELESRQQLWRVCLAAALGLLLVETWYAGRSARREMVVSAS